jgi:WD40 repeat protein
VVRFLILFVAQHSGVWYDYVHLSDGLKMDNRIRSAESGTVAATSGPMHRLFLSHAGIDSEAALRLARRLEASEDAKAHGLKVWVDKADLVAGGRWKDALQSALDNSTAFAVYVGSRGVVNWVWDEVSVALDRVHKEPGYPIVPILAPGTSSAELPSFLSQYQGIGDTEQVGELQKLLRAVLRLDARAKVTLEREPFVGLQAYTSREVHLFFGREQQTDDLVALLRETPFVLVAGSSGSGKSSLVLAGLVPAFRGGRLGRPRETGPDETIWHVIETRPGTDPFGRLADSVRTAAEQTGTRPMVASDLADLVRTRQPDKVRDAVLSSAPRNPHHPSKVLLVVDQFEEFRTSPHAASYVSALLRLATPGDDRVRVVLTMRRDYLYIGDSFSDLRERLQNSKPPARYLLHRMSADGLHAAITKPLVLAGVDETDREDLARGVLKDVGDEPGELALLQMALWRTWSEAKGRGTDLVRAYTRIGRLEGALAEAAEEVFEHLSSNERQRAETLFVRLIRPGEAGGATRRVARLDEFDEPTQALAERLSRQEQWRLLTIHEDTIEIAHEQLATQWLRYQRWIANQPGDPERGLLPDLRGDDLRLLQSLIAEVARWQATPSDRKAQSLASGMHLELYGQLASRRGAWLSEVESRFIQASAAAERVRAEHEQAQVVERERLLQERAETEKVRAQEQSEAARRARRLRNLALAVAALLLLASVAAVGFWSSAQKAAQQAEMAAMQAQAERDKARIQLWAMQARRAAEADTAVEVERAGALALESLELARKSNRPAEADAIEAVRSALIRLPLGVLSHGNAVFSLAVLADGRLASGDIDGKIKLWLKDGTGEPVVFSHGDGIWSLAVLADGRLASGGDDSKIKLWPKEGTGEPVVFSNGARVFALAVLTDGRLASGGEDGTIKLWPKEGNGEPVVLSHGGDVLSLAVLADGRLASGGRAGTIKLWPREGTGEPVVLSHGAIVMSLAVLADGRLASGGSDGKIKLWPKDGTGEPVVLSHGAQVEALAVLADDRLASAGSDDKIKLWPEDGRGEPVVLPHGGGLHSLAVLADGRLASSGMDGNIKLWPKEGPREPVVLSHGQQVEALAVLADGRLASAGYDGKIKLWPKEDEGDPVILSGAVGQVLAVLADGRLASGGFDGKIRLWPKDGMGEPVVLSHGAIVMSLAVLADGRLASGGSDGKIKLWPRDGTGEPVVLSHGRQVEALVELTDGRLASAGYDGKIKLWPKEGTGEPVVLSPSKHAISLAALADGRLASGSSYGKIELWPKEGTGEPTVLSLGNAVNSLVVLKDGRLASGSGDGKIRLWPKEGTGEPVVLSHGAVISSLAELADGRLASGGWDGEIKLWLIDEEKLITALCLLAGRNLTKDEWARYIGTEIPHQPSCRDRTSNWRNPD